jgi:hypothetical protein
VEMKSLLACWRRMNEQAYSACTWTRFENMVLTKIWTQETITRELGKLYKEEIYSLYSSPNISQNKNNKI